MIKMIKAYHATANSWRQKDLQLWYPQKTSPNFFWHLLKVNWGKFCAEVPESWNAKVKLQNYYHTDRAQFSFLLICRKGCCPQFISQRNSVISSGLGLCSIGKNENVYQTTNPSQLPNNTLFRIWLNSTNKCSCN